MKKHAHHYAELEPHAKESYERRAAILRSERSAQHAADIAQHVETLAAKTTRAMPEHDPPFSMLLSSCRLGRDAVTDLQNIWHSDLFRK
eukprot:4152175-Amphidinium_carterae.1